MEDDEDEHQQQPSTPFWLKNDTFQSSSNWSLATLSSILFNATSVILVLLVAAAALIFIFFLIPSIMNFTSQIFRPNSVKRSWDSLNLVLILFAIICAFLSKTNSNNNETPKSASSSRFRSPSSSYKYREPEQGYDMYSYSDRMTSRLRSSSSYPDLRQQQQQYTASTISPWISADDIDRSNQVGNVAYRFSDDTQLRSYQFTDSSWNIGTKPSTETVDEIVVENPKPADVLTLHQPTPVPSSSTPPQPQPHPPFNPLQEKSTTTRVNSKSKRTYRAAERTEEASTESNPTSLPPQRSPTRAATVRRKTKRVNRSFDDAFEARDDEQLQKPPSPPPPPPHTAESDLIERKKSGGVAKDFLSSFYGSQKRKKKRERQRSSENFEQLLKRPVVPSYFTTTTPPPPPPPPPPSVFQNIFSTKKSKGKKSASDQPDSIASKSNFTKPNTTTKIALAQPPIPAQSTTSTPYNISRGNESPLYGIPEPPPFPPFGMPVWKFVVEGDYVRLKSINSSRSGSPEPEEDSIIASSGNGESMRSEIVDDDDEDEVGGDSQVPTPVPETAAFCPSPDVNTKADNFIARFRAGLKMEKVNSVKGVGLSRLGPVSNINNHK